MKLFFLLLILFSGSWVFAQTRISGNVLTAENDPLPGASVILDGTTVGTISGSNGEFSLENLRKGNYLLKVSYIGYQTFSTKMELTGDLLINVVLQKNDVMTDEVFVYSTRAGAKTPVASGVVNAAQIADKNLGQDIPYLLGSTPSFVSSSDAGTGIGYTGFRIRGTDANRINITVNGIPVNDSESHSVYWVNMPDFSSSVENIQVQRGVGTSTHGAGAFGATINMQTNSLHQEPYASYNGAAGSFNTTKNTFETGTGLINNHFSMDARLSAIESDGFIDRSFSNLKSYYLSGGYYSSNTIIKLLTFSGKEKTYQAWNGIPSVRLNSDTEGMKRYEDHWLYSHEETEAMLASNPRTYNLYTYDNETDNYKQNHYQLLFNQKFGPCIHLNAALHFTHGEGYYEQFKVDEDYEDYGINNVITGADTIRSTDLIRQKWLDNNFYGGTFSFNYQKEKTDFTLGAGWNEYDGLHYGKIIWAQYSGNMPKGYEWYRGTGLKTDFNIYAKYNYALTTRINLYADLQYRNILHAIDGIDDDLRVLTQDHNYDFFNPKLGIFYQPSASSEAYLSWAVGHREPSRSNFTDADPNGKQPEFETLNDFEAGYTINTKGFSAGVNMYLMMYRNQLILTGEINDVGSAIMANVDKSYRAGIEITAGTQILPNLNWEVNATFSRNKILDFTEYVDNWDTWSQEANELGTTDIAFSPSVIANSSISYEPLSGFKVALISQYVGKQYIDNSSNDDRSLDPYFVNNLKISYTIFPMFVREIQVHLLVSNLFNEMYETNAWVYSYIYEGSRYKMDGYFPQAGTNAMLGLSVRF